jgi:hypothetical protein
VQAHVIEPAEHDGQRTSGLPLELVPGNLPIPDTVTHHAADDLRQFLERELIAGKIQCAALPAPGVLERHGGYRANIVHRDHLHPHLRPHRIHDGALFELP